jgi:hypothetical protein
MDMPIPVTDGAIALKVHVPQPFSKRPCCPRPGNRRSVAVPFRCRSSRAAVRERCPDWIDKCVRKRPLGLERRQQERHQTLRSLPPNALSRLRAHRDSKERCRDWCGSSPNRAARARASAPPAPSEVGLCHRPLRRHPITGLFFQRRVIGGDRVPQQLDLAITLAQRLKRGAEVGVDRRPLQRNPVASVRSVRRDRPRPPPPENPLRPRVQQAL